MIDITVQDDGIGISKQDLPQIFERFYRSAHARAINHNGTGLGLAISRWIIEAHGGTIRATSEEGKGSSFIISIPILK